MNLLQMLSEPIGADPRTITMVMEVLANRIEGKESKMDFASSSEEPIQISSYKGVGLMKISGTLVPRHSMNAMCGETFVSVNDATLKFLDLAANYDEILLQVDSGGGSIVGVPEFANAIRNSTAHVTGFTDTLAGSGGYWILSACDEVVATASANVGSIGVYIPVMKSKDNPYAEVTYFSAGAKKLYGAKDVKLTSEESEHFQTRVDEIYDWFTSSVATFRGKTQDEIKGTEAGVVNAKDSVGLLVDRIVNNIMEV